MSRMTVQDRARLERNRDPVAISIIVPFRNAGQHFQALLESLVDQDVLEAAEIVAVDNGSTDGSRAVAQAIRGRIPLRVIDAVEKFNGSYARNVGVRAASGRKLLFVDADDEVEPGYISALATALDSHAFATSRVDSTVLNEGWVRDAHGGPWEGIITYFNFMPGTGVNVGIRRELFDAIGGFPENFSGSQDVVLSWRVQQAGYPLHFVPQAVYRYRYRETLVGLFRQTRNWGASNVLLYRTFREAGMPGRPFRTAVGEWRAVLAGIATAQTKAEVAPFVARLGYCVGRLIGSIRYRCAYL